MLLSATLFTVFGATPRLCFALLYFLFLYFVLMFWHVLVFFCHQDILVYFLWLVLVWFLGFDGLKIASSY